MGSVVAIVLAIAVPFGLMILGFVLVGLIGRWGPRPGVCTECGYALRDLPASAVACPECGASRRACEACGYDITGQPDNSLCPECGAYVRRLPVRSVATYIPGRTVAAISFGPAPLFALVWGCTIPFATSTSEGIVVALASMLSWLVSGAYVIAVSAEVGRPVYATAALLHLPIACVHVALMADSGPSTGDVIMLVLANVLIFLWAPVALAPLAIARYLRSRRMRPD